MANISLKRLFEAEDFKAKSKETGKLVHFKSKDSYQAALKAGTHEDPNAKKGEQPKGDIKPNDMFGGDYSKDRGDKTPTSNTTHVSVLPDSQEVKTISKFTNTREKFIADFINKHKLDASALSKFIEKGSLRDRMDVGTAMVGNPGNEYEKDLIKKFGTSKSDPQADVKSIVKDLLKNGDKEFRGAYKLADVVDDFKDSVDDSDEDGAELKARLDKGENGVYVQTDETEGTVVFNDGSQYQFSHVEDGPIPVTKVGKEEPNTSSKLTSMLPKKASQLTWKDGDTIADMLNKEVGLEGIADTMNSSMDPNNNTIAYTASSGDEPTYTLYMGMNDDYGKPDEFRVSLEPTYGNDPAKLQGKHDKSFKSSKDAMTYMTALGKKYKKELQMDDAD